jgi:hypothetical protein
MSRISNNTPTSDNQSIPFSILDLKSQAFRLPVSKAAQILLSELLSWSGERGFCWWGVSTIARDLNWSNATVWRKAKELKKSGLLEVIPRPGRSNYWVPLPGPSKMKRLQNELTPIAIPRGPMEKKKEKEEERCTIEKGGTSTTQIHPFQQVSNENVIDFESIEEKSFLTNSNPQKIISSTTTHHQLKPNMMRKSVSVPAPEIETPKNLSLISEKIPNKNKENCTFNMDLVLEIEQLTGDRKSRGCWIKIVKTVPENTIYAGLSSLRIAMNEGIIKNPGSYLVGTIKSYYPDLFSSKKYHQRSSNQIEQVVVHQKPARDDFSKLEDNIIPASPEIVASMISKIKSMLNSPFSPNSREYLKVSSHVDGFSPGTISLTDEKGNQYSHKTAGLVSWSENQTFLT